MTDIEFLEECVRTFPEKSMTIKQIEAGIEIRFNSTIWEQHTLQECIRSVRDSYSELFFHLYKKVNEK